MLKWIFFFFLTTQIFAQTVPVGMPDYSEERLRNQQLLSGASYSFTIRPVSDSISAKLLPASILTSYNSDAPMGWNDGAMIPARGLQTYLTAGFFLKYKALSFQLKPELVYAANPSFETFSLQGSYRAPMLVLWNSIDIPERFGNSTYTRFRLGQSALRLSSRSVSVGISTENLWWGPGFRNSLLMSNNAPGFLHGTFNSVKPVKTFLGSFEFQLIGGRLEGSGVQPSASDYLVNGINYVEPKSSDARYISAVTINYQPRWIPGLFLGFSRAFHLYTSDMGSGLTDVFPFILPFEKKRVPFEDEKRRDQLASISARWVFPASQVEIYGEIGWNDYPNSLIDWYLSLEHSRAYLFGMRKAFPQSPGRYVRLAIENTSMDMTADRIVRNNGPWYRHDFVRHGYTNEGKVLGSGIGPGSNLQTFDVAFVRPATVAGFTIERYAHNMDYFYDAFKTYDSKWVDVNFGGYYQRHVGSYALSAKLNFALIRNYQWVLDNVKLNTQLQLSATRYF
ncbi:capsule assembly Wzi family protein [Aquirufa sp. A-Brett2-W8]